MEKTKTKIIGILSAAEETLRGVIAEAAKDGDYDSIDLARRMAGAIRDLVAALERPSVVPPRAEANHVPTELSALLPHPAAVPKSRGRGKKKVYPKFSIRKDTLYKISWSKKEKKEYQHKVGKDVYDRTVQAIQWLAQAGKSPFTAEQVVEVMGGDSDNIPVYQVYVALAFLRELGVVQRIGREGYTAANDVILGGARIWSELAASSAQGA
jgi:hypothetical protein